MDEMLQSMKDQQTSQNNLMVAMMQAQAQQAQASQQQMAQQAQASQQQMMAMMMMMMGRNRQPNLPNNGSHQSPNTDDSFPITHP